MRNFMVSTLLPYVKRVIIEKKLGGIRRLCGRLWEGDKCIQDFHEKNYEEKYRLETTDSDRRIMLKWFLKKW